MPKLKQFPQPPQTVNQSVLLPTAFPTLPDVVLDRFGPDMVEHQKNIDQWWLRVKRTLQQAIGDATAPQNTLAAKVDALQQAIFQGSAGDFQAQIDEEKIVRADEDGALASLITTLSASFTGSLATVSASVTTETMARVTADAALASQIVTLTTAYQAADATLAASVTTETTARSSADSALASQIVTLTAAYQAADTSISASVTTETSARVAADAAIASSITTLTAAYLAGDSTLSASISSEATARASADSALSTRIDDIVASAGNHVFVQSLSTDGTPIADGPNDLWIETDADQLYYWDGSAWVPQTDGSLTAALARITTIESAYASTSYVTAHISTAITAALVTADAYTDAQISSLSSVYATPTYVNAQISTAITAEVTNRNTAISSSASSLTTAYVAADAVLNTALGGRISTLESQVQTPTTGLLARVTTVETTYATSSAVSADISTAVAVEVSNRNSAISASVSTEASARATADGFLEGKYTLKVGAGDVVTAFNITSSTGAGTDVSTVSFDSSLFQIWNGTSAIAPFSVAGGIVTIGTELDVGTTYTRTRITSTGLSVGGGGFGGITLGGGSGQSDIRIGTSFFGRLSGGAGGAVIAVGGGGTDYAYMTDGGKICGTSFAIGPGAGTTILNGASLQACAIQLAYSNGDKCDLIADTTGGADQVFTDYLSIFVNGIQVWIPYLTTAP